MVRGAGWLPAVRRSFVPAFVRCIQLLVQEFSRLRVLGFGRHAITGGPVAPSPLVRQSDLSPPHPSAHMPELRQARIIAGTTPMPAVPKASGMYVRKLAGIRFVAKTMIRLAMVVWQACSKIPYRGFSASVAAEGANSPTLSATETASANV
jgi:hypothetical protein